MSTPMSAPIVVERDSSASLAMFRLLQPRFRRVEFGLGGRSKNLPNRLNLDLSWIGGGLVRKAVAHYDLSDSHRALTDEEVWNDLKTKKLSGTSFEIEPAFVDGFVPKKLEDYSRSKIKVVAVGNQVDGIFIFDNIIIDYWGMYFPSALSSETGKMCRILIEKITQLEEAIWDKENRRAYDSAEINKLQLEIELYKQRLRVMG